MAVSEYNKYGEVTRCSPGRIRIRARCRIVFSVKDHVMGSRKRC